MKKISIDTHAKIYRVSYLVAIFLMVMMVVAILFSRKQENIATESDSYTSIESEWTLTPGGDDYVDIKKLGAYFTSNSDTLSIYWTIPNIEYDESFIFRSKDVYCYAYVGDELLFETEFYESPFYLKSPGNNWNFFTLPSANVGDVMELRIKYVYGNDAVSVDHFYYGDKSDWALDFLVSKLMAILLSLLIIFASVIILIMDHSTWKRSGKHSLLYLGIYGVLMGMWSLIETNTLQLFINDGRLLQLMDNLLMVTDTLPLFFYLDAEFDIFKHAVLRFICVLDILYIFTCLICQFAGWIDLHYILTGSWIATSFSFVILVWMLITQAILFARHKKIKKSVVIQVFGFVALMVIAVICLPIYAKSDGVDRAESIRVGMLVMLIMSAAAGQVETYELIKHGARYEIVKNLAYKDALTGLGNRTAYLEKVDKYQSEPPAKLGVIFFDVNNLKTANDRYGHEVGDELIGSAAETIRNSFEKYGKAYRTGGDEFIVFIEENDLKKSYEEGLEIFKKSIESVNKSGKYEFGFNIAHGFSMCENCTSESIMEMINDADAKMYENKKMLKEMTNK